MALVVRDRVKETTTTTGTGTVTLAGASAGFQSFSVIGNANTTYYAITDSITGAWEVGIGTYSTTGPTLSRDTILESSTGGTAVSFGAGSKDVFCTYPAERSMYVDGTTIVPAVSATLPVVSGGTGLSATPSNGQVDIGNGTGFTRATLTAGTGVAITNGAGSISIAAVNNGTVTSVASGNGMNFTTITGSGTVTMGTPSTLTTATTNATTTTSHTHAITTASANTVSTIVARDASGNFSAGTITASLSGNATTATTATNATNVALTTSATSSAFKVPFANTTVSTTGNYGLLQDSAAEFTYNPSTNTLTVGTVSGALSGNATTATTATTATNATNVAVTTSATASAFKVPFANTTVSTTGNYGLLQDSEATFTYNPSTNTLTAGTFSGSGASLTTLNASNLSSGTVAVARGGTGITSVGTSGNVLTSNGSAWVSAAPVSSNITAQGLFENANTISANYTIGTGNNAVSAGPITINSGVTVTVPSGSVWVIV